MRIEDVLEVVEALAGLRYWLDGGWGVDALLGTQTREHDDVDAAIDRADLGEAVSRLRRLGFVHRPEIEPGLPARCVLVDPDGRQVDLHPLAFDETGDGWQELPKPLRGRYPAADLRARGLIGGRDVPCIGPQLQLQHHAGYEPTQRDLEDMLALAERFGVELPEAIQALL
jgi:lincosamide nucleotidyltransferase A/C/D/E